MRGGENVPGMLETLTASDADGVLLGPGVGARYAARSDTRLPALVSALDIAIFGAEPATGDPRTTIRDISTPPAVLRDGASAAKMLLPLGWNETSAWGDAVQRIALRATECAELGLPLMVEPVFWGASATKTDDAIAHAARVSVELGAHLLKLPAPGDPGRLADIVEWSPVPVYIVGGNPDGDGSLADRVVTWMEAGATGVVVGRNVWNRDDPSAAIAALRAAVHDLDATRARALFAKAGPPLGP